MGRAGPGREGPGRHRFHTSSGQCHMCRKPRRKGGTVGQAGHQGRGGSASMAAAPQRRTCVFTWRVPSTTHTTYVTYLRPSNHLPNLLLLPRRLTSDYRPGHCPSSYSRGESRRVQRRGMDVTFSTSGHGHGHVGHADSAPLPLCLVLYLSVKFTQAIKISLSTGPSRATAHSVRFIHIHFVGAGQKNIEYRIYMTRQGRAVICCRFRLFSLSSTFPAPYQDILRCLESPPACAYNKAGGMGRPV